MAGCGATEAEVAQRSVHEPTRERAGIVRVDGAGLSGGCRTTVSRHMSGRDRPLFDKRRQCRTAEAAGASQVARVAPGERDIPTGRVIREVAGAELPRLADHATAHRGLDGCY